MIQKIPNPGVKEKRNSFKKKFLSSFVYHFKQNDSWKNLNELTEIIKMALLYDIWNFHSRRRRKNKNNSVSNFLMFLCLFISFEEVKILQKILKSLQKLWRRSYCLIYKIITVPGVEEKTKKIIFLSAVSLCSFEFANFTRKLNICKHLVIKNSLNDRPFFLDCVIKN